MEYEWRKHWRETTEGGTHVVAVFRDPDGTLVVVAKTTMGLHRTWNATSEGYPESGSRSYDLVPVAKEPEWEPWTFNEVPLDLWYRAKGCKQWQQIDTVGSVEFRMGTSGEMVGTDSLFLGWECTKDPRVWNPVGQRCGKLKVQP